MSDTTKILLMLGFLVSFAASFLVLPQLVADLIDQRHPMSGAVIPQKLCSDGWKGITLGCGPGGGPNK